MTVSNKLYLVHSWIFWPNIYFSASNFVWTSRFLFICLTLSFTSSYFDNIVCYLLLIYLYLLAGFESPAFFKSKLNISCFQLQLLNFEQFWKSAKSPDILDIALF